MSGPSVGVVVARHTRAGDPDYSCFNRAPSATCPFDCKVQDWEDGGKWKYASATLAALRKRAETIANWTPEQLARRPASKSSARRRRASTCAPRRRQRRRRTGWRARRRERRSAWRPEKPTRRAASGSGRMPRRTISEGPSGGTAATGPGSRPSSARATAISAKISRWARTTCLPHDARVTTAREHVDDSTSPRSPP